MLRIETRGDESVTIIDKNDPESYYLEVQNSSSYSIRMSLLGYFFHKNIKLNWIITKSIDNLSKTSEKLLQQSF